MNITEKVLERPYLSICIPTYNRAEVVYECVKKALEIERKDIEVVVCDNCSSDNTKEKLSFVEDERFKYYRNERNIGYINIHEVMKHAAGKYCFLLSDEDDVDILEIGKLIDILKNEKEKGVVITNCNERKCKHYRKGRDAVSRLAMIIPGYMTGICFLQRAVREVENNIEKDCFFYQLFPHQYIGILILERYNGLSVNSKFAIGGVRKADFVDYVSLSRKSELGLHWDTDSRWRQFKGEISVLKKLRLSQKDKILVANQLLFSYHSMIVFGYYQIITNKELGWKVPEERRIIINKDKKKSKEEWKEYSKIVFDNLKEYLEKEYLMRDYRYCIIKHPNGLYTFTKKNLKKFLMAKRFGW